MADERRGIRRWIELILDPSAALRMEKQAEESLRRAGHRGGEALEKELQAGGSKAVKALTSTLKREYERTMSQAQVKLGKGLIDKKAFDQIEAQAKAAFNGTLIPAMERLQREGKLTESQFAQLSRQIKKTGTEGERDLARVERGADRAGGGIDRLRSWALRAGSAFLALFAINRLRDFGATSVQTALESEGAWANLGHTLEGTGAKWSEVEQRVRDAAAAFEDVTVYDDDAYAAGLQRLTALTNNQATATAHMQLAADVAAKFFKGQLEPAIELVGKALNGNTRVLKQVGIVTKDASDGLRELADRSMGAAEARAATFEGKVERLNARWGNFKEAVGNAIIAAGGGTSALDTMSAAVEAATAWVEENKDEIAAWARVLVDAGIGIARFVGGAVQWFGKFATGLQLMAADFAVALGYIKLWRWQFADMLTQAFSDGADQIARFAGFLADLPGPLRGLMGLGEAAWGGVARWANDLAASTKAGVGVAIAELERLKTARDAAVADIVGLSAASPPRTRTAAAGASDLTSGDVGEGARDTRTASASHENAARRLADAAADARREAVLLAAVWDGPLSAAPDGVRRLLEGVLRVEREIRDTAREREEAAKRGNDTSGLTARLDALNAEREGAERLYRALAPLEGAYEQSIIKAQLERAANRLTPEQAEAAAASAAAVFNAGLADAIRSAEADGPLTDAMQQAFAAAAKQVRSPADTLRAALPGVKADALASQRKADASIAAEVELLARAAGMRRLNAQQLEDARRLESEILEKLENQNLGLKDRLDLEDELLAVREAAGFDSLFNMANAWNAVQEAGESAAQGIAETWGAAIAGLVDGTLTLREAFDMLWRGTLASFADALSAQATLEAAKELAMMFSAIGSGDWKGAFFHGRSAAAWAVLGGAAQGVGSRIAAKPAQGGSAGAGTAGTAAAEPAGEEYGYSANRAAAFGATPSFPMPQMAPVPNPLVGYSAAMAATAVQVRESAMVWNSGVRVPPINVQPEIHMPEIHLHGGFAGLAADPSFQKTIHYANTMGAQLVGPNGMPRNHAE